MAGTGLALALIAAAQLQQSGTYLLLVLGPKAYGLGPTTRHKDQ